MSSVLERFPDGEQGQAGRCTSTYFGYPPEKPDPYSDALYSESISLI